MITGFKIKNAAQPNAAKDFRVSGTLLYSGQWINLAEGDLDEDNSSVTFHLSQSKEVRYIKFEMRNFHASRGGLSSFTLQTGDFSQIDCYLQSTQIVRNDKKL